MIGGFLGGRQIEIVVGWLIAWIVLRTAHQLSFYQTQCTSAICRIFQTVVICTWVTDWGPASYIDSE